MNHRIDTQDVLFAQKNVKRVVEIGPANVLAIMAQRTLAQRYEAHDAVHCIRRKILTWTRDAREICFEIDAAQQVSDVVAEPTVTKTNDVVLTQPSQPAEQGAVNAAKATMIGDTPLSPILILRAIIAQKLKRSLKDVSPKSSIKELAGGQ